MKSPRQRRLAAWLFPASLAVFFCLAGLAFIPLPGLQHDELFFSAPIFYPDTTFFRITIGTLKIPLMVISYTGALKTWLYAGLFQLFQPNVWSVRIPVLLMGAGTILLTWVWVRRIAGHWAAVIATALLATDTLFLLTDVFDWGPVAIQHLLLMAGLVAVQRSIAGESRTGLALGFFIWGLGMWDKALHLWPLIGLAVACLVTYPRLMFRSLRRPETALACVAFLVGMLPLLVYNFARRGETATANAKISIADFPRKVAALRGTVNGLAMFGFIVPEPAPNLRSPRNPLERASAAVSRRLGARRVNWMLPAWFAGLACFLAFLRTPCWRLLLFLAIATAVTWLQMALTVGAGYGAHHVILLWPLPPVFLGVAFAAVADRIRPLGPAVAVVVTILIAGNLLTTNGYFSELALAGGTGGWTDAIYSLSDSIDERTAGWIGLVDWGYLNGLALLHQGRLHLFMVNPEAAPAETKRLVGSPGVSFIQHTEDKQLLPGINDRFRAIALRQGFSERTERTIFDRNGRPVFEIFHFEHQ